MNNEQKKLIIFKRDIEGDDVLGETCYVKFLDKEQNYAIFYKPLIAPKNFKEYLKQNKIEIAYQVINNEVLNNYQDLVYTLKTEGGVYKVEKGIKKEKKLVLLVDYGMEISLSLPKYSYVIKNNIIILKPYKKAKVSGYCYVIGENEVNDNLKKIMIPVVETVPGILNIDTTLNKDYQKTLKHK